MLTQDQIDRTDDLDPETRKAIRNVLSHVNRMAHAVEHWEVLIERPAWHNGFRWGLFAGFVTACFGMALRHFTSN